MRSIFFGVTVLLATAAADAAQAQRHGYVQALIGHRQPIPVSRDNPIRVDQIRPNEDALTRRIEQDNIRLDRVIEICPSC